MTKTRRGQVVAGGVGGLAAGLALATVVLPQLADTLKPTAFGIAVITGCLGVITIIWQLQGGRSGRARDLEAALEFSPCPLGDACFDHASPAVVAPDPGVVAAMRSAPGALIVRGPRAADKYSAALAAARVAYPGFVGLVPFDADGLATVQASGFEAVVGRTDAGACVVLENLDRFLDTLDTRALPPAVPGGAADRGPWPQHPRSPQPIRIVATIENRRWQALNARTDDRAQAFLRLRRTAAVVALSEDGQVAEVTPAPSEEQLAEAGRLIAETPAPSERRTTTPGPVRRRHQWLAASLVLTAAVVLTPFLLYLTDRRSVVQPPPISDQMATIISQMQSDLGHGHVVLNERVQLHETEQESWIVGVQHGDGSPGDPTVRARRSAIGCKLTHDAHAPSYVDPSDEIRVYDVHGGWLTKELDFQPTLLGSQSASLVAADEADGATNGLYENGVTPQFIGGYSVGGCLTPMIVPFAIQWDNQLNPPRYDLRGLTEFSRVTQADESPVPGPGFSTQDVPAGQASFLRSTYATLATLHNQVHQDQSHTADVSAYPVSAFAVTLQPSGRLLVGYQLEPFDFERGNALELGVGQLRSGGIAVFPCMATDHTCSGPRVPEEIDVPPDRSTNHALLLVWPRLERHWVQPICEASARGGPAAGRKARRAAANCFTPN